MFDKKSTGKVAEVFFQNPSQSYHLRGLAREADVSASTASLAVDELVERGLVKVEKGVTKEVRASRNEKFTDLKMVNNLKKLISSGLLDKLEEVYRPDALVLFGSYSRGEDDSASDIDIAVVNGKESKKASLSKFEEELERGIKIQMVEIDEVGENFRSTLANGIVLRGYLDI
ncbi:MAG: nucleotidyltransferase domain-containing protein [Hadesarchaea archaeon]|nr:nucleotidyltransferase domain-containing protein [Hadesarchaea archaeon]